MSSLSSSLGLYGNEGVLPARWQLRVSGKSVVEQLKDSPTLLWFGPRLGLDTQQCMELLSLTGALLSLMTLALPVLRDCRVFLVLWILYLSLYQVQTRLIYSTDSTSARPICGFHWLVFLYKEQVAYG